MLQPLARYTAACVSALTSEPPADPGELTSGGAMAAIQARQAAEGAMHVLLLLLEAWSAPSLAHQLCTSSWPQCSSSGLRSGPIPQQGGTSSRQHASRALQ